MGSPKRRGKSINRHEITARAVAIVDSGDKAYALILQLEEAIAEHACAPPEQRAKTLVGALRKVPYIRDELISLIMHAKCAKEAAHAS